jgi:hypothetical protein
MSSFVYLRNSSDWIPRQLDMDLSLLSTMRHTERGNTRVRLSYDIACRYGLKLWERIPLFQPQYRLPVQGKDFILGVPKFHLPGHGRACHSKWSLNYRVGWGRTDGEGIERFWAIVNRSASASREMTSGNRQELLDYTFGASNFRKLVGLGEQQIVSTSGMNSHLSTRRKLVHQTLGSH